MVIEERKKLLLEALRSGKFKQARGVLKDSTGHCCLGVACEVYLQNTKVGKWSEGFSTTGVPCKEFSTTPYNGITQYPNGETEVLPHEVMEWFGFDHPLPRFVSEDEYITLANLNDSGKTFEEIALVIEEKF